MKYYELTVYLKDRRKLCKALFENKKLLDDFVESLSSNAYVLKLGNIIFKREDFYYAETKEKNIK